MKRVNNPMGIAAAVNKAFGAYSVRTSVLVTDVSHVNVPAGYVTHACPVLGETIVEMPATHLVPVVTRKKEPVYHVLSLQMPVSLAY